MGIVLSDAFDAPIDHEYLGKDLEYAISDYDKKRRVLWIKEIDQNELPESLLWIQTGQRAIFDITKNANEINPVISNEYIYKGNAHVRVHVGTHQKVSSSTWLQYQLVINQNAMGQADDIYQKNKVQSEGHTILEVVQANWDTLSVVGAALFSEIETEIKGLKFKTHGPLTFLVPGSKARRNLERKKMELDLRKQEAEIQGLELDNRSKEIQNEKEQLALEEIKNRSELFIQTEIFRAENLSVSKSQEQQDALKNMKISQKIIGDEISPKKQVVTQNLSNFEFE